MRRSSCILAATFVLASMPAAARALELPARVLAPVRAEVRASAMRLERERAVLGRRAIAQREAQALERRISGRAAFARAAVGLVPGFGFVAKPAAAAAAEAKQAADAAQRELEAQTERAAQAQGDALDAERRLKALQRAASSDPAEQTTSGVGYRFGSGGPVVSAASIDRYLESKASPMAGSGAAFLQAGLEHDIDPRLVVAIAGAESYFGLQTCAAFNAWGWGCPNGPIAFSSWAQAFDAVASGLRERYLDDGLTTVGEIHLRYAPPNAANDPTGLNYAWPDNVARFLVEQGGDPQDVGGARRPSR